MCHMSKVNSIPPRITGTKKKKVGLKTDTKTIPCIKIQEKVWIKVRVKLQYADKML